MKQEPKRRYETGIPLRPASIEEAGLFYSQADLAGRVSYADGTTQAFKDPQKYLQTIREELPFRNTTGFRYETLTADPQVRKEVDDIILDFAGEENPRRACGYGLTGKGLQALRDAADPALPHTYAWFVLTDCNTQQEQIHRGLTLDEARRLYVYIEDLEAGRYYLQELENEGYVPDTQKKTVYVKSGETTEVEWENTPISPHRFPEPCN